MLQEQLWILAHNPQESAGAMNWCAVSFFVSCGFDEPVQTVRSSKHRDVLHRPSMKFVKSGAVGREVFGSGGRNKYKPWTSKGLAMGEIISYKERIKNKPRN